MTQPPVLHAAEETLEAVYTRRHASYPAYKPSGVEWLRDVPEHWETLSLKHIANVQFSNVDKHTVEDEVPVRLCNYTDVYYNDSITEDLQFMVATATKHEISRFKLERGDVLITKDSEDWSDIAVPSLVADEFADVLCGYHLAQIRPRSTHCTGAYLARAFASSGIMDQFHVAATGVTRYGLPKNALRKAIFPVPPLEEQQAIARFLDEQTQKIDDLIEAKRSLLDLLKEKRQAVITHAVTRGLDPAAKLKSAGVEWLGDVPEHWDIPPLYARYDAVLGKMLDETRMVRESLVPYLRNIDVQWDHINTTDLPEMDIAPSDYERFTVREGDLLVCEGGEVGRCSIWKSQLPLCGFQKAIHRLRPRSSRDIPRFLFYVFRCVASYGAFIAGSNPNTIPHLTGGIELAGAAKT